MTGTSHPKCRIYYKSFILLVSEPVNVLWLRSRRALSECKNFRSLRA